jgi:hypothetical protein
MRLNKPVKVLAMLYAQHQDRSLYTQVLGLPTIFYQVDIPNF